MNLNWQLSECQDSIRGPRFFRQSTIFLCSPHFWLRAKAHGSRIPRSSGIPHFADDYDEIVRLKNPIKLIVTAFAGKEYPNSRTLWYGTGGTPSTWLTSITARLEQPRKRSLKLVRLVIQ
ncbi:hypothetical protein VTL71DRAFT_1362, partial [Oculimacula yallundae]